MSIPQANTLVGDQISRSYIFMEDTLRRGLAAYIPASIHNEAMLSGAWTSIAQ